MQVEGRVSVLFAAKRAELVVTLILIGLHAFQVFLGELHQALQLRWIETLHCSAAAAAAAAAGNLHDVGSSRPFALLALRLEIVLVLVVVLLLLIVVIIIIVVVVLLIGQQILPVGVRIGKTLELDLHLGVVLGACQRDATIRSARRSEAKVELTQEGDLLVVETGTFGQLRIVVVLLQFGVHQTSDVGTHLTHALHQGVGGFGSVQITQSATALLLLLLLLPAVSVGAEQTHRGRRAHQAGAVPSAEELWQHLRVGRMEEWQDATAGSQERRQRRRRDQAARGESDLGQIRRGGALPRLPLQCVMR
mmetsp:Transcript_2083/g.6591  ORF Transcript_2083/g.6591 Transcript_2083/m.6591 type:complete len:307 (-) Transcript_2083:386-1306(-)